MVDDLFNILSIVNSIVYKASAPTVTVFSASEVDGVALDNFTNKYTVVSENGVNRYEVLTVSGCIALLYDGNR